jgi:alpha-L-fucosidase
MEGSPMAAGSPDWFTASRYGLFIHLGLYSLLGRGEWVLNRERLDLNQYRALADRFDPVHLDFDSLIRRASAWGMRYAVLTAKHHEGFCLYDSSTTSFSSTRSGCGRDLVREFVEACRKHGMRIGIYHSLNDWSLRPDAVDALENKGAAEQFVETVHAQFVDVFGRYGPVDICWFDGWWPFDAVGWRAQELIEAIRSLQPNILINNRTGLSGDFGTPEGHVTAQSRPWEACMTLNESWGYHSGDHDWKSAKDIAAMLRTCAAGGGNLLLNLGPRGDGRIPQRAIEVLDRVGTWLVTNAEAIYGTDRFEFSMGHRQLHERGDWTHHGQFTARENTLYWHVRSWPGPEVAIGGLETEIVEAHILGSSESLRVSNQVGRVVISGLPETCDTTMPVVVRLTCQGRPSIYNCGGMRTPAVAHPRYDPNPSEIANFR